MSDQTASTIQQAETVQVRPVETPAEFRAFFEFPWRVYADDPNWAPPLLSMRRELLSKDENPAWDYMDGQYFAAWRGATLVGTITAFINHRHNDYWGEHIGWFGTFEVLGNDAEVAQALLQTAKDWVQQRGYDAIRGPQTFTTHEECGLLVEGFDPPVLLMPYNPPYYQIFIEDAGFTKSMDLYSLWADRQTVNDMEGGKRLARLSQRVAERSNIHVRSLDARNKQREFRTFRDIYNRAWDKNWGFVPMNDAELDALIESLGMLAEPDLSFFAEINGEPVGFAMVVPDFNELLREVYPRPGVPEFWSMLKIGWKWKIAKAIQGARLPLMGVVEEHRNKGVDIALIYHVHQALFKSDFRYLDSSWVLETNPLISIIEKLGAQIYRTHRYYEYSF